MSVEAFTSQIPHINWFSKVSIMLTFIGINNDKTVTKKKYSREPKNYLM